MDWSGGSQCVVPRPAIWGWGPGGSDAHSCLRTTGVENKYLWANTWLRAGHGHWAWAAEQKQPYSWSQIKLRFRRQGFLRGSAGEGNSTHCRTLAWEVAWMEEPGGLQSMGSLRVRHHWATSLSLFTFMRWRRKWQPTPVFLPGESQGRRSLVGCRLWGHTKSDTTEAT